MEQPQSLFVKRFNVETMDGTNAFVGDGVLDIPSSAYITINIK